jgi:hypothetical protein
MYTSTNQPVTDIHPTVIVLGPQSATVPVDMIILFGEQGTCLKIHLGFSLIILQVLYSSRYIP